MNSDTINDAVTMAGGAEGALLANRYRIVRQLGQGGMGSVWLAEDTQLDNKLFAIKMLPSILVSNKRAYRQLKEEALVAMKLTHPNIVTLRAFEENNGNPFLVMDYIDGQTLDDYLYEKCKVESVKCKVSGGLSEDEVIRLLKPIAAALDYAHGEGVVHRDVKPANVMIRKDGHPFILDFGIAREIQETMTRVTGKLSSGTLLYMSPEQLRGLPPKASQDVYSFASMAYECLKGEPPFSRGQIEYQILNEKPKPLPERLRLSASIMRGLSKTPENRPDTCVKVLLTTSPTRQMPSARPQVAVPPRPAAQMTDRIVVRPKRNIVGIVAPLLYLVTALLVLGGVLWHREAQRQENARKLAAEQQREELRRRHAEDERKAQEEAARKKAEADRLAKMQQEEAQRKAEEDAKRREAEKQAKERELAQQKEEEARKAAEAEKAAVETAKTSANSQRQLAVAAYKAAVKVGAKEYVPDEFTAANVLWTKAKNLADKSQTQEEFTKAASLFGEAETAYRSCTMAARIKQSELEAAKREKEEREREARHARFAQVEVGANVRITTDNMAAGVAGVVGAVASNKDGKIVLLNGFSYSYDNIAELTELGGVNQNAVMRNKLLGLWRASTKETTIMKAFLGGDKWTRQCDYTWIFYDDNTVSMSLVRHATADNRIGKSSDGFSGIWAIEEDGKRLAVNVRSGVHAGVKFHYDVIAHGNGTVELRIDEESVRKLKRYGGVGNERNWYDENGTRNYEAATTGRTVNTRIAMTETPMILRH